MRSSRLAASVVLTTALTATGLQAPASATEDFTQAFELLSETELQASSTTPVSDNRIAAFWEKDIPRYVGENTYATRACTTSYLGNNYWITARHCVAHNPELAGYLEQSDGEFAGIANIYLLSEHDDIAILKTGPGIQAEAFKLPTRDLKKGEVATLLGYSTGHDYASAAYPAIVQAVRVKRIGTDGPVYKKLLESTSNTGSRTCRGDSGAGIFIDDTIYAVHTAGAENLRCTDQIGSEMFHSALYSRVEAIKAIISDTTALTEQEQVRAQSGLAAHPNNHHIADPAGSTGSDDGKLSPGIAALIGVLGTLGFGLLIALLTGFKNSEFMPLNWGFGS
ncbi:trypsin-like serine protease [Corynebacterium caspium]|uniref:trypsin-like serine protease n=1 Tax=Corynebacterium caspium TaxID=234828 RepID=UPI0014616D0F|nr:trypsin-like serine protease [Corynebacterium caspium]